MTQLASDDFNRANGGLGANWTTTTSESVPVILSNEASADTSTGTYGSRYTGITWPNDQYAEAIIGSIVENVTDNGAGPACRIASGTQTHYFAQTNTVETRLYKVVSGTFTQLGTDGAACATGDTLRLECQGTSISVKKNGATIIGPVTDSAISAGDAGIWIAFSSLNGKINSWAGGDFGGSFPGLLSIPLTFIIVG